MRSLNQDLEMVRGNLAATTKVVNETVSHVNSAYNNTWAIYRDVYDLMLPEIQAQDIKDRAQAIADEVRHSSSPFFKFLLVKLVYEKLSKLLFYQRNWTFVNFWLQRLST